MKYERRRSTRFLAIVESFFSKIGPLLRPVKLTMLPETLCWASSYRFADDNVEIFTHRESSRLKFGAFAVHAFDVKVFEVFEAGEASEALTAFSDSVVCVKRVERNAVFVGKADSVVLNLETCNIWQGAVEFSLAVPYCPDGNFPVLSVGLVDCLNSVDDHLNERRVDGGTGPDVVDRSFDIDVAHSDATSISFR